MPSIMSASLAQSVEHAAVNRSVNGSSPLGSAIFLFFGKILFSGVKKYRLTSFNKYVKILKLNTDIPL